MTPTSYRPDWDSPEVSPPIAPDGYRYECRGGNMRCFDRDTGKRISQTRFLIPISGCLFDAEDQFSLPGVKNARLTGSVDMRLMVCGCAKCHAVLRSAAQGVTEQHERQNVPIR